MTCNECIRVECPYRGMVTVCPTNLIPRSGTNTEAIGIPSDNLGGSAVNWRQVRIQAAIAAMQGILSNPEHRLDYDNSVGDNALPAIAIVSAKLAEALVEELKKED